MAHTTILTGSKGGLVKLAQTRLNQRGATPKLVVDGDFGPLTKAAVIKYQTDRKAPANPATLAVSFPLSPDGVVGQHTWFRLDPDLVASGSHSLTVKLLQELLKLAGNNPGAIDSVFGPNTEAAVIAFQGSHLDFAGVPLVKDGIVGIRTWAALKS